MRSKFFGLLVILSALGFLTCPSVFAMPSDADLNTAQMTKLLPEGWGLPLTLGFGTTADYVIDRTLDDDSDIDEGAWWGGNIYWDPLENVHTNWFVGVAQMRVGSVPVDGVATTKVGLETETGLAAGGSVKADILEFPFLPDLWPNLPKMKLFGTGGYRHADQMDVEEVHASFDPQTEDLQVEVSEWQATLGVSQRWENPLAAWGMGGLNFNVVTYLGVQYSDVYVNISGSSQLPSNDQFGRRSVTTGERNSDVPVAVVTGLQILTFNDTWAFDVEGRFIAETAVSVNGRFRW